MKAQSTLWPSASSPCLGAGAVDDRFVLFDPLAADDDRPLVEAGALVGAHELEQRVVLCVAFVVVVADDDLRAARLDDFAVAFGDDHLAGVDGGPALHAGADQRHLGAHQRHGLALHVRAHQGARFASSCSRNGISDVATETICFGETSMKVHLFGCDHLEVLVDTHFDALFDEVAALVEEARSPARR